MTRLSAGEYRERYGPTTGDRIRLGDTDLWIRVQEDRTAPGDEPIWGYAKNLRLRMAQSDGPAGPSELDFVLAGALVVDPVIGVVKADIGIKDGRIAGIGRAGSPEISDGIDLVVGPHTKPYMAYGLIVTPGAVDSHVHTIGPELLPPALSAGVTTLITAGFEEPPCAMERVLAGLEGWPVNIGDAGGRAGDRGRAPRRAGRGRCHRLQDPRGQRRLPGPHRPRAAVRGRPRRLREPPHGRAARVRGAGGHDRGHRRAHGSRLPRGGDGRRSRAGPAGAGPGAVDPVLVHHADTAVRRAHGGGAPADDHPEPRPVVERAR